MVGADTSNTSHYNKMNCLCLRLCADWLQDRALQPDKPSVLEQLNKLDGEITALQGHFEEAKTALQVRFCFC